MMKRLKDNVLTLFDNGKTLTMDCNMELVVELMNSYGFISWQMAYDFIGSIKINELISAEICKEIHGNICPILIPCRNVFYNAKDSIMSLADNKKIITQKKVYEIFTSGSEQFVDGIEKETINGMISKNGVECLYGNSLPKVYVQNDRRDNKIFGCINGEEYYCPDIVVPDKNGFCYACMIEIYPRTIDKICSIFDLIISNKIYKKLVIFCYGECVKNMILAYEQYNKNIDISIYGL